MSYASLISDFQPFWIIIFAGFLTSFVITFFGIPSLVRIARIKGLLDLPGTRKSHSAPTPRLGGTMIFAGVIIASLLFTGISCATSLRFIIAGLLILFFVGLKDDIVALVAYKKLAGQIIAALILVIPGNIRLTFTSMSQSPEYLSTFVSITVSVAIILLLINSFNLIDGIDGLASGVGIIASIVFGVWFILNNKISMAVLVFSLLGSLAAFFWYNVFSKKYKIFLGDTGSMITGFLMSLFLIRFLEMNLHDTPIKPAEVIPAISLAIFIIPVFDLFRILFVRIIKHKSPFSGDNNHIHHKILILAGSHLKATIIILSFNVAIIAIVWILRALGNAILIAFLFSICLILLLIIHYCFIIKNSNGNGNKRMPEG